MSWGTELWDKYNELSEHSNAGTNFLDNSVASFVKERGKLEADYAKGLRALVKKYTPKEVLRPVEEEYSHMKAYKQMLKELGFQAGQHEILAESFTKEQYKSIQESVKLLRDLRKKNHKEHDRISQEMKHAYKSMDAAKDKFRKAFDDVEKANTTYEKANADGSVSRNEVNKLQLQTNKLSQLCEMAKGKYAQQLVSTNEFQNRFYRELLPRVLEGLQDIEQQRINTIKHAILNYIAKQKEVQPIIVKCFEASEALMLNVDPVEDTEVAIERYKSGDIPPGDFKFDDIQDPRAMLNCDPLEVPTNLNLYPEKKKLDKAIQDAQTELVKKVKELKSLEQMVSTYKNNPKFGNSKHFTGEIQNLHRDIADLEAALASLRTNKTIVEKKLDELRSRSPMVNARLHGSNEDNRSSPMFVRDRTPRSSQSSGSLKSLSMDSSSVGGHPMNTSPDSCIYDVPETASVVTMDNDDNWDDHEFHNTPPPPPPPPPMPVPNGLIGSTICVALYNYPSPGDELQESNITMTEGEEFDIVEGDSDGWTRVRRRGTRGFEGEEGYVPTSFVRVT